MVGLRPGQDAEKDLDAKYPPEPEPWVQPTASRPGEGVIVRPGLAEARGSSGAVLKAGEAATVTGVGSQTDIRLRRDADGEDLGDGFEAADLAPKLAPVRSAAVASSRPLVPWSPHRHLVLPPLSSAHLVTSSATSSPP